MNKYHFLLLISLILTALVQVLLKVISMKHNGNIIDSLMSSYLFLALIIYAVALVAWFISASKIEYSILIPANIITVVLGGVVGYFFFGEPISLQKLFSYILIVIGVVILMLDTSPMIISSK